MASPTRHYREEALAIQARADLRPVDKQRLLEMLRVECSLALRANREGEPPLEPELAKVRLKLPSREYLERRAIFDPARAGRAEGGRIAYPKMQAALRKRRERVERSRLRQLHKQIDAQIEALM